MRIKLLFIIFSFGLILGEIYPQSPSLTPEARLLELELALAKGESAYVLLDTEAGTLSLKARGSMLREWLIVKSRMWGFPVTQEAESLVKKSTLLPPKREEIKPGSADDKDTFDIQALELADMPGSFSLVLDKGVRISVKSSPKGMSWLLRFSETVLRRLLLYPLQTTVAALGRKNYHVLEIELESKSEAQALYWSLEPGTAFLLFPQADRFGRSLQQLQTDIFPFEQKEGLSK